MKQQYSDLRTRRRRTPQQRAELLTQYRRSGLSQRDFVQFHGLGLSTLTKWLRAERLTGVKPPGRNNSVPFQEVNLSPQFRPAGWAAEVALADGAVLRLSVQADVAWATELLQALRRPC
jgi:transposase-like protein